MSEQDSNFEVRFRAVLGTRARGERSSDGGAEVRRTHGALACDLDSDFAERFVRSIKSECPGRTIFVGGGS